MQTWRTRTVAHPTALVRYRLLTGLVGLGIVVGAGVHASLGDLPGLFSLVLIAAVPVAGRLVAPRIAGVYGVLGGVALADGVARDVNDTATLFVIWAVVVVASHLLFIRPRVLALSSGNAAVLSGAVLVITERHVDLGLHPIDQMFIGLALYIATIWVLALAPTMLTNGWANRDVVLRRNLGWLAVGVTYSSILVGLLALLAHPSDRTSAATVAALVPIAFGFGAWQTQRNVSLRRVSKALTEAAVTTPWPAGAILETLSGLVGSHVRASRVAILDAPTDGSLWAPIDASRFLVVERLAGDFGFTHSDARVVAGLTSMARGSLDYADRERRLQHQALTDHLTGLWSYQHWLDLLLRASTDPADDGHRLGVVFLDCDGFKQINSRYGHLDADIILATLGDRLLQLSATVGWCFARFGGDEFTGWLREHGVASSFDKRCQELAEALAAPIQVGPHTVSVTASIGRAVTSDAPSAYGQTAEELVESAEIDMRRRKLHKPGAVLTRHAHRDVVQEMLAAGDVAVAYQPIVTLADREIWGVEALLRGRSGSLGLIPPPVLVESAAEAHLLDAVTGELMEQALDLVEQARTVCRRPVTLTLNLEVQQFHDSNELLDRLVERAEASDITVVLELAEREPMPWTPERDRLADELAMHGIGVGLDDLGAGESRLTLVGSRAWDLVKLDRSLLLEDHLGRGPVVLHHLMGILDDYRLGHTLMEGIETATQERIARDLGIRYGQGNGYAAAMGGSELLDALRSGALARPRSG